MGSKFPRLVTKTSVNEAVDYRRYYIFDVPTPCLQCEHDFLAHVRLPYSEDDHAHQGTRNGITRIKGIPLFWRANKTMSSLKSKRTLNSVKVVAYVCVLLR